MAPSGLPRIDHFPLVHQAMVVTTQHQEVVGPGRPVWIVDDVVRVDQAHTGATGETTHQIPMQ